MPEDDHDLSDDPDRIIPPRPVPPEALPRHIAIIMDGNGRWARERGLSRSKGHEAGVEAVRNIVKSCSKWGVGALTLYAFSSENWRRPKAEVGSLMMLLRSYLKNERRELKRQNVRLRVIGDIARLPFLVRRVVEKSISYTASCDGLELVLALSYGGRDEITRAVRQLALEVQAGTLSPDKISENDINSHLDTAGLPDPDLLVRTAGEMRISNFLLWQASYSEYYSSKVCWPDFTPEQFAEAIRDYVNRVRKFGEVRDT